MRKSRPWMRKSRPFSIVKTELMPEHSMARLVGLNISLGFHSPTARIRWQNSLRPSRICSSLAMKSCPMAATTPGTNRKVVRFWLSLAMSRATTLTGKMDQHHDVKESKLRRLWALHKRNSTSLNWLCGSLEMTKAALILLPLIVISFVRHHPCLRALSFRVDSDVAFSVG